MIVRTRLDRAFGPFGSSTGLFIFIGGAIAVYYSFIGIILAITGAFIGLTSTSTIIDTDNKRIKFSNDLFGVISTGKWIDIKPDMLLGLKKAHHGYRSYIRGTQTYDIHINDIRIILYSPDKKQIMTVNKATSLDAAKAEREKISNLLGLKMI